MRKFVIFLLAAFALLTSQTAVADDDSTGQSATKHGTVGQVQSSSRFVAPASSFRQPHNTGSSSLLRIYILLMLMQNLITTTKAPEVTTTVTSTTAPDPCKEWKEANGCRYKVFSEDVSWNEARTKCQSTCSSKLAHEKVRNAADLAAALTAVSYNDDPIWMGISDEDSFAVTEKPKWDKTTDVTTLTFISTDYATAFGTPGCGFHTLGLTNLYRFERCTFTDPIFTPKQYLCEVC